VHRDLKPANVMLTADGTVKIMDFGVSLHVAAPGQQNIKDSVDRLTREGRGVGTIRYMSPEQLLGGNVDARSDLFALGIVVWEMLTGSHPFLRATNYATAAAIVDEAPTVAGGGRLPREASTLKPVLLRLLEKEAERRYPSAAAVLADLDRFTARRRVPPLPGWRSLAGLALALALIALLAWLLLPRP
jgi:eukaryotic-like serine/threonine-protein kinase